MNVAKISIVKSGLCGLKCGDVKVYFLSSGCVACARERKASYEIYLLVNKRDAEKFLFCDGTFKSI